MNDLGRGDERATHHLDFVGRVARLLVCQQTVFALCWRAHRTSLDDDRPNCKDWISLEEQVRRRKTRTFDGASERDLKDLRACEVNPALQRQKTVEYTPTARPHRSPETADRSALSRFLFLATHLLLLVPLVPRPNHDLPLKPLSSIKRDDVVAINLAKQEILGPLDLGVRESAAGRREGSRRTCWCSSGSHPQLAWWLWSWGIVCAGAEVASKVERKRSSWERGSSSRQ